MDQYKETFQTWNKVANAYQDAFMHLEIYNLSYLLFCELLKEERPAVLEIGCGPGNIAKYMLPRLKDPIWFGVDIAPNMVALANKNNPGATFEVWDTREISEISGRYEGVVCGFCLPYLSPKEADKFFKDSFELLCEKGYLYLSFVVGSEQRSGFQTGSSGDRVFFYYHELKKVEKSCQQNGLEIIHKKLIDYPKKDGSVEEHTVLILQKIKK